MHRVWIAFFQLKILLCAWPGSGIPSISPVYAQHRRRFTQVIHRFVHRKAWALALPVGSGLATVRIRQVTMRTSFPVEPSAHP